MFDFIRICTAVPEVAVGDVSKNTANIIEIIKKHKDNADVIVFPELATTGYTCGDLFFQKTLTEASNTAIGDIAKATKNAGCIVAVGAPLEFCGRLFNCVMIVFGGKICGIVPKTFLPGYGSFCEKRWFSAAEDEKNTAVSASLFCEKDDYTIPFGTGIVFDAGGNFKFGVEIGEDAFAPVSPSSLLCLNGAELILNPSANGEIAGRRQMRKEQLLAHSSKLMCVYAHTSAGCGESTSEAVFSGHSIVCENGRLAAENERFIDSAYTLCADADIEKIRIARLKNSAFSDCRSINKNSCNTEYVYIDKKEIISCGEIYSPEKLPFVPSNEALCTEYCSQIFKMQVEGLKKRVEITGGKLVIGVSGGLDSTLALLVCVKTMQKLGRNPKDVIGVTMPCFGTTDRTFLNAQGLMDSLGITMKNIEIKDACRQHFADISHDENIHDVTYENAQARERTQILMDLANKYNALVVGTGDLSELALGWCTYNGDQMSMYGVNAGIPKTLLRHVIDSIIQAGSFEKSNVFLADILDTPISPELLPPDENGVIAQKTEDSVGPYELHDFFIYNVLNYGFSPDKVYYLATKAFVGIYDEKTILKWLKVFYRRFFTQQYKRSAMPEGISVTETSFSPRSGLHMPGDACAAEWLKRIDEIKI